MSAVTSAVSEKYRAPEWKPEPVLPVNGRLPERQPRYRHVSRVGKLRCFPDEQVAYDCGMWLRAVVQREFNHVIDRTAEDYCGQIGLEVANVGNEGTGPAGGYLLPAPIISAIIDVKEKVGVSRQALRVLPTGSDSLTVPRRTGGLTVYYPGEGNAITDSDVAWGQVSLFLRKRAVASYLTNELVDDAIINVVDDTFREMAYALALQEDNETINGTGASTYGNVMGLLPSIGAGGVSTAATNHDTWAELDMADMTACVGKLPDRYHIYGPAWICSFSFFNQVMVRLAYAAGGVTMAEVMGGTANVRQFMGYPVYLTPWMPTASAAATKCALFGAFTQAAILADRGAPRLARSDDYKFLEDKVTLRATMRYDINVFDAGTAIAAGAYVALATAS
jgi:HK97 family phage major capsid protein